MTFLARKRRYHLPSLLLLTSAQAQIFTSPCSEGGITQCNLLQRRCIITNEQETCGPCLLGFVEFPEGAISSVVDSETTEEELQKLFTCYEIDKITTALYISRFEPIYTATANLSDSERLEALRNASQFISAFNRGTETFNETVELALNQFAADVAADQSGLLGYERPTDGSSGSDNIFVPDESNPYPPRIDWREAGAVTPVKNQGRCGCCWAISVTGALEGAAAISSGLTWLKTLSYQQFLSCDKAHKGCNGGFPAQAFDYADDCGVAEWVDYPFTDGQSGETTKDCNLKGKPIAVEAGEGYKVCGHYCKIFASAHLLLT